MKKMIFMLFSCAIGFAANAQNANQFQADVIIYGGTSAAVTAAVQTVKQGKTVIVVSPDKHLGGLTSGGLGFTDTGNKSVIGGLAREFYHRVYMYYDKPETWKWQKKEEYGNKGQGTPAMDGAERTMWIFEPRIAEQVFEDFVKENNLKIYRDEWLDRKSGVKKKDGRIVSIKTLKGKTFTGKMFIDATYEGDLMAAAGVKYHVGREANSVYHEEWNGIQAGVFQHGHYFKKSISPYKVEGDPKSGLLPYVNAEKIGKNGTGDNKIQAYCFRMCLSQNPENRIPFAKPAGYDPAKYELLARVYKAGWTETFDKYDPIPNKKTDTNNHGPFSTDFIGQNYDYPDATYERRRQIIREHELYQKGLMYYLQNDEHVPQDVRTEMQKWGLPKDEFKDNGGWPHQIYVREARRMLGKEVMTENETLGKKAVSESVGMGSYSLDAHNAQRYVKEDGFVQNEGDIGVHPKTPYAISYASLVPKKEECQNLLVPVCLSASHIAYGSIRMEPVFMILGQSAASAAVQAIDAKIAVQDVDYGQLRTQLLKDKQKLEFAAQ
ncbi:FAD-dependent oxidoreductase [Dyadobacter sandarakinus]|uniref:FAD-dependent oxidoreductase n=2 Tax=Dyadobacter sandarakinus TaxID=2747268 RepID=A0ABX7IBG3_9BACT|nr:FAD-dependent oxidoreductase [Dyadobacter sandarakinus]